MTSFIIPAYNEARLIGRTIEALHAAARAHGTPYEIVLVDDDSTDGTAEIAVRAGARVVPVQARQIAVVRNAGARAALGNRFVQLRRDAGRNGRHVASGPVVPEAARRPLVPRTARGPRRD